MRISLCVCSLVKIFLSPSCLWRSVVLFMLLCENLFIKYIQQFWNAFFEETILKLHALKYIFEEAVLKPHVLKLIFEGAILKPHVLKLIFSGSHYFNFLIQGFWLMWLLSILVINQKQNISSLDLHQCKFRIRVNWLQSS